MKITEKINSLLEQQANKLYKAKRYEEAILVYDQTLKLDSGNIRVWNNKGLCLTNLARHEEAVFCYDKALKINPKYVTALCNRGVSLIRLSQYKEALLCFLNVLEIDPQNTIALSNRTLCESEITKIWEEKKKQELEDVRKKAEVARKEYDEWREKEKRKLELEKKQMEFDSNCSQLIREIELSADERPCPKCNELEVLILSLSPNARSLSVRCKHCNHEYRIKMEPDDPEKIIRLHKLFLEGRGTYSRHGNNAVPFWRMEVRKQQSTNQRKPIPSSVKKAVWKRDGGKCVNCGSDIDIEYDHIIPVAKGGSSTIQNIQILCKKCNRKKSASIE